MESLQYREVVVTKVSASDSLYKHLIGEIVQVIGESDDKTCYACPGHYLHEKYDDILYISKDCCKPHIDENDPIFVNFSVGCCINPNKSNYQQYMLEHCPLNKLEDKEYYLFATREDILYNDRGMNISEYYYLKNNVFTACDPYNTYDPDYFTIDKLKRGILGKSVFDIYKVVPKKEEDISDSIAGELNYE